MNIAIGSKNKFKINDITRGLLQSIPEAKFKYATIDVEELGNSYKEIALLKAISCYHEYGIVSLGDDSGLEVYALNNLPGIYSARYSGGGTAKNINLLLYNMRHLTDINQRKARYVTTIAIYNGNKTSFVTNTLEGYINFYPSTNEGFGYDSIFIPIGYNCSIHELNNYSNQRVIAAYNAGLLLNGILQ